MNHRGHGGTQRFLNIWFFSVKLRDLCGEQ